MKSHISILVFIVASMTSEATPLSSSDRNAVYTNLRNSCFLNQTNSPANAGINSGQLSAFYFAHVLSKKQRIHFQQRMLHT